MQVTLNAHTMVAVCTEEEKCVLPKKKKSLINFHFRGGKDRLEDEGTSAVTYGRYVGTIDKYYEWYILRKIFHSDILIPSKFLNETF